MRHFTLPEDGGLITENLPKDILHGYDKIFTEVYSDSSEGSRKVADIVVDAIHRFEKENPEGTFKLGLTTGASPASLYKVLSRYYSEGRISFKNVAVFSIDEYYPSSPTDMQSRNRRLHQDLLNNIDILPENIHIPNGTVPHEEVAAWCANFDKEARNLDLLVMGIGEQGQVGFNEAGTSESSRTRTVLLSYPSRKRQTRYFNGDISVTPKEAITIGISTMMSAKQVILMAWGETKAEAVARVVEGEIGSDCPGEIVTAEIDPSHSDYARKTWGVENNIFNLGCRAYIGKPGGEKENYLTWVRDLANGTYCLPWDRDIQVR